MTNATVTRSTATPAAAKRGAPVATPNATATVEDMRAAVAAVDAAGSYSAAAAGTLRDVALARYVMHASRFVRDVDGVSVLPENNRKDVAALVWLDAHESTQAPKVGERTPALVSMAQYITRFGTVATDTDFGIAPLLIDAATATAAYASINEDKSANKSATADRAFTVWLSGLLDADSAAITRTLAIMASDAGKAHRAAFARAIAPTK